MKRKYFAAPAMLALLFSCQDVMMPAPPLDPSGGNGGGTVAVTGVAINLTHITLQVNGDSTRTLIANVSPNNATNKAVTWTSSRPEVATITQSGFLSARAAGETTITVRTVDGGHEDFRTVTVNDPTP